ncbi:PUR family DNA/RNA-binding protein [Croceimicrobium hydrocarbonivorans]|uniref:PUR family DNA/RNA-binding protein n=1 Tax=Croceimicrobium hydrocarbonivorans TaxID=2761580 RepID=A0A7H0VE44_9FLAO|nr:PUR family DNA/RNA-binding protein [Croceimicrobium hydrocarbonivorans]QNR23992.1 PUR family DNA/RNA-binding protein [Croceimicrobium hydrocarbonivorans]
MSDQGQNVQEEIHSKVLRAGRRTYFFDVRATKADDYYLTITESKKHTAENGNVYYKKHKIYLYKEDFEQFSEMLNAATDYIIDKRGEEVISDRHEPDFHSRAEDYNHEEGALETTLENNTAGYTDVSFEDI